VKKTLALVALAGGLWTSAGVAQDSGKLTLDPVMTRGPATAPVTIVEFSDYQ